MLVKLTTKDLKIGMFVAELDRPWADTPFLIQGFMVEEPSEVASLRLHCHYVYIDPARSAAGVLPRVRAKRSALTTAATGASRGEVLDLTGEESTSDSLSDTGRFMRMAHSGEEQYAQHDGRFAKKLLRVLLGRRQNKMPSASPPPPRHPFMPPDIDLVAHPETQSLEDEIDRASSSFEYAKFATNRMVADLLAGKPLIMDHVWKAVDDIVDSMLRNGDAMMWVAMTTRQDASIYGHGVRAAVHLVALGKHLGLTRFHLLQAAMAGALLDIGKTMLPLQLLTKPDKLNEKEFAMVRDHVKNGLEMIRKAAPLHDDVIRAIAEHHEREDGSGYPNGLTGNHIGLYGRMAAIVDTFVALTDERPFAQAMSPYMAFRKLTEWSKNLFHGPLTEQYIQAIGVFPVGSLVQLSSGELAVVVRQNRAQRLKPQVLVVTRPDKSPLSKPRHVDLNEQKLKPDEPPPLTISDGLAAGSLDLKENRLRLN